MCKTVKSVEEFYRDRQYYTSRCKKCIEIASAESDAKHRDSLSNVYIKNKLIGAMMQQGRRSGWTAKHENIITSISPELIDAKRNLINLDNLLKQKRDAKSIN